MSANSLEIAEVRSGQACVLALSGRIDSTNADQLIARVSKLFAAGEKNLVVDFKEVLYLTSAAFRVLLVATDEAERSAARFALCSVMGQVRELFEMGATARRLHHPRVACRGAVARGVIPARDP